MASQLFLGLISGTSADGVDAALVEFSNQDDQVKCQLHSTLHRAYPKNIKDEVTELCTPTSNEIDRLGQLDILLGEFFADTALSLLKSQSLKPDQITAIGSHGQTIRHRPSLIKPFTLQLADPNTIAEITGITTVADFRRRDMSCGGQGAPLAPAFHHYLFSSSQNRCVLNIGGISNITILCPGTSLTGYDTGPGNGLMDAWINSIKQLPYDDNGQWAKSGEVCEHLLKTLLNHSYFKQAAPKSTGREEFHLEWLQHILSNSGVLLPADVQATLCELTAITVAQEIQRYECREVFVCGGGAHNAFLLERIAYHLPLATISSTESLGLHPDWVEAACFAWLAKQRLENKTANLASVTGASKNVILGAIY